MTTISDLARDVVEEIFSRVPFTSLRAVRCTCKRWNDLSKNLILGHKVADARKKQLMEFMTIDSMVFSFKFDLQGIQNNEEEFVHPYIKQISIPNHDQVEISQVHHCDGILLCVVLNDPWKLVVWNPYLGQSRLIKTTINEFASYALGYDNKRNHKILRVSYDHQYNEVFEVYDLNSDSWRVLDFNPNPGSNSWRSFDYNVMSLNGSTYFFVRDSKKGHHLLCFDFTTERFGQRLPLPPTFHPLSITFDTRNVSWVRDDKLAALCNHYDTGLIIEIWISTKIEPNAVSWSNFLTLDLSRVPKSFLSYFRPSSFFIDEEKKVAVFLSKGSVDTRRYQMAYIIGDGGYFKSINLGVVLNSPNLPGKLVGSSYVPSLVKIN